MSCTLGWLLSIHTPTNQIQNPKKSRSRPARRRTRTSDFVFTDRRGENRKKNRGENIFTAIARRPVKSANQQNRREKASGSSGVLLDPASSGRTSTRNAGKAGGGLSGSARARPWTGGAAHSTTRGAETLRGRPRRNAPRRKSGIESSEKKATTARSGNGSCRDARAEPRTCLELSSSSGFVSVASSGVVSASHTRVSSSTLPSPPPGEDCLVRQSSRASSFGTSGASRDAGAMSTRPPGRGAGHERGVSRFGANGRSHSRGRRACACVASRRTRRVGIVGVKKVFPAKRRNAFHVEVQKVLRPMDDARRKRHIPFLFLAQRLSSLRRARAVDGPLGA